MRNLNQDPGAVSGLRVATAGAPVRQVDQDLHALEHNVVGLLPGNIRDKPNAARIMLIMRVIETLGGR